MLSWLRELVLDEHSISKILVVASRFWWPAGSRVVIPPSLVSNGALHVTTDFHHLKFDPLF